MKNLHMSHIFSILSLCFTLTGFSQTLYNGVGHIPTDHQVKWTNAGLQNPISAADYILYITDPAFTGSDDDKISAAMAAAQSNPIDISSKN